MTFKLLVKGQILSLRGSKFVSSTLLHVQQVESMSSPMMVHWYESTDCTILIGCNKSCFWSKGSRFSHAWLRVEERARSLKFWKKLLCIEFSSWPCKRWTFWALFAAVLTEANDNSLIDQLWKVLPVSTALSSNMWWLSLLGKPERECHHMFARSSPMYDHAWCMFVNLYHPIHGLEITT